MQKLQFWHYIHNANVPAYGNFVHDYNKKNPVSDTEFFLSYVFLCPRFPGLLDKADELAG